MIKFKKKLFSKSVGKYLTEHPTLPISAAALGMSALNLKVNTSRQKEAKDYQERHLQALQDQSKVIQRNTKALEEYNRIAGESGNKEKVIVREVPRRRRISLFGKKKKEKDFSMKSSIVTGAQIGAGVAGFGSLFLPKDIEGAGKFATNYNKTQDWQRRLMAASAGIIVGATLGAICGGIKSLDNKLSRRSVTNDRLMSDILTNLKKTGFKENSDYTRDPKMANLMETKVCVAISRTNGDLRILVNYVNDKKLKNLSEQISKNTPNTGIKSQVASNKYNEITISTISDSSVDATLVSRIVEQYIHSGFPVYLVEVG